MYISALRIKNYKSFYDSGDINFDRGLNILIGPNSSGKTALLETLGLRVSPKPHLSEKTKPARNSKIDDESSIEVAVKIGPEEFNDICRNFDSSLIFPSFDNHDRALQQLNSFLVDGLTIRGRVGANGFLDSSFDYGLNPRRQDFSRVTLDDGGRFVFMSEEGNPQREFGFKVLYTFGKSIYRFHAERPNVGRCAIGLSTELKPDASNLAEVLHVLQSKNHPRFENLKRLLTRIFPFIPAISVSMEENGESHARVFEIRVWLDNEREDLAIPLNECGTGIGQALAILYVLVNSSAGRTLAIDEPQSFLHPGAARTLVQIMNEHQQHQYFISTHSPEILAVTGPSTITALDYDDGESKVSSLSLSQSAELRKVFDGLGVDFSIFFATKVVWVEGPTEEKAFPLIVEKYLGSKPVSEITILPLADTGGLQAKKHAKRMFEIYQTLSGAHALVPPIAAVILDDENREPRKIADLKKLGGGLLHFLPRRCYENYLLDAEAIAAIANEQEDFAEQPINPEQVTEIIEAVIASGEFLPSSEGRERVREEWLCKVDGARLLAKIFSVLSDTRVAYQKTIHSVSLTQWLLANNRGDFQQIADLIANATSQQGASVAV
jgi:predicted ATPase